MENVTMTAEERREFEAYRAEKQKKEAAERRKQQRTDYAAMVDDEVRTTLPVLRELSEQIKTVKNTVFSNFDAILKMKSEVLGLTKDDQRSHTFTTSDSKFRLTLGVNTVDGYRDTVEDGIAMVKNYIQSLAKDETSKALVNAVLRLLSRDGQGNIKPAACCSFAKWPQKRATSVSLRACKSSRRATSCPNEKVHPCRVQERQRRMGEHPSGHD